MVENRGRKTGATLHSQDNVLANGKLLSWLISIC
jgi:hypothetical protein